jgi:catechol 2,3-dioxygenase-like lactoylglutathione lyase family enzyme
MRRAVLTASLAAAVVIAAWAQAATTARAQPPEQSPRPLVAETMPVGGDLAKTIRFYHDLLGLQSRNDDPRAHLDWLISNPFLDEMYAVGGDYRGIHFTTPGSPVRMAGQEMQIEPIQWKNAKRKPLDPSPQDPGATRMIFHTRDIDRLAGYLKLGGAKVVTAGGAPVAVEDSPEPGRAIVFDDGNGFFVELVQPDKLPDLAGRTAPAMQSFIYGADTTITVADIDRSAQFFREVFELAVTVDPSFHADPDRLRVLGLKSGRYRKAAVAWPDRTPQLNLIQFTGVAQKTLTPRVGEPNATLMRIFVRDMDPIVAKLKAFPDAKIINVSGGPIRRGVTSWLVVRIPGASTYLQLIGLPSGRIG